MKKISFIIAMSDNHVIGHQGQLLWHLPNDLKHFKTLTWGKPIIMGRKTYESIGRSLPGRQNIVLTKQSLATPGVDIVHSVEEALAVAKGTEVMIIGGGEIYRLFSSLATTCYLTYVHAVLEGDTFFEEIDKDKWQEIARESHPQDERHAYDYDFVTLTRRETV